MKEKRSAVCYIKGQSIDRLELQLKSIRKVIIKEELHQFIYF